VSSKTEIFHQNQWSCDNCDTTIQERLEPGWSERYDLPSGWMSFSNPFIETNWRNVKPQFCSEPCAVSGFTLMLRASLDPEPFHKPTDPLAGLS